MAKSYQKSFSAVWWIGGFIVVAIGLIIFLAVKYPGPSKSNREVALACTTDKATRFHIHPNLEIVINGERRVIPTNIGINGNCMNAFHTHDTSGQIHVESPQKRDFTLSDFFAIWNESYSKDQILDFKVDDQHIIRETVNGQEGEDYENTVLRDKDKIVISYEERK